MTELKHDPSLWNRVYSKWNHRFLELAELVGDWSKDPSSRVGCVIADDHHRILSTGYNGFPVGVSDDDRLADRAIKYPMVVHAEANAALQAGTRAEGCTAYCNLIPCASCMGLLINCGIKAVVCREPTEEYLSRWSGSVALSERMAEEAGVRLLFAPNLTAKQETSNG